MAVTFDGQVKHAMSEVRRRKVSGDERESMKNILNVSKEAPYKIYRDSLTDMLAAQYATSKRGPSSQEISIMETEAKSALNTHELLSDLFTLRKGIKDEDERTAIENILKRKCFGYIHFVNVADEVNIICFTEGSLKWHREYFNRDWVFFDATGFRSLKIPGYKKILYYSVVTGHSFTGHPPLPVAEYITSEHTKHSIFLFLNQLHKNLKIICNSTDKPKLIKTDFSLAL